MKTHLRSLPQIFALTAAVGLAACAADYSTSRGLDASSEGTIVATSRAQAGGGTKPARETAGDPEGIVRLNGSLYYLKDRGTTILHGKQRVTNGLYLEKNGEITIADGRRVRLVEGYMVTTGGEVIEAPKYLH